MNWIKRRVLNKEILGGTWVNMGSEISALITAQAGLDWLVLDMEHGFGDYKALLHQVQGTSVSKTAAIVRVPVNDPVYFKRFLDLGVSGIMVPWVNNAQQAQQAVCAMRYPPEGIRGLATCTPATEFGKKRDSYLRDANDNLLLIVQIETCQALDNVDEIAAVDGVDVLFVGPSDLSLNLGTYAHIDDLDLSKSMEKVRQACAKHGKAAGILLKTAQQIEEAIEHGFSFIGFGSDTELIVEGMRDKARFFRETRRDKGVSNTVTD